MRGARGGNHPPSALERGRLTAQSLFAPLLRNVAISGVAYAIVSGVGLFLAPFLIGTYGLAGYGQILIARTLLPSGVFALFDLGLSENATRQVASARGVGRWEELGAALTLLVALALVLGIAIGAGMLVGAAVIADAFSIPQSERAGFLAVIQASAALQPLLLLSLVAEGVIKGFERFDWMRTIEVLGAISYCALAIVLGLAGYGANWIAAGFLASLLLRLMLAIILALRLLSHRKVHAQRWDSTTRREVLGWSLTMLGSKFIGTVQNQLASPLIGILIGPAAVGES